MTDHEPPDHSGVDPHSLLNPGPSAIVAFTLAVLVLMGGNNLMVLATQSLFGVLFTGSSDLATFFVDWGIGAAVPAAASILLARRTILTGSATWEVTLGRAGLALGAVALVFSLVMLLGAAIHLD